jgi:hypothetical protein
LPFCTSLTERYASVFLASNAGVIASWVVEKLRDEFVKQVRNSVKRPGFCGVGDAVSAKLRPMLSAGKGENGCH